MRLLTELECFNIKMNARATVPVMTQKLRNFELKTIKTVFKAIDAGLQSTGPGLYTKQG